MQRCHASPDYLTAYSCVPLIAYDYMPHNGRGKCPGTFRSGGWQGMTKWQKFRDETLSGIELKVALAAPGANIGIVCGTQVGKDLHVVVLDFDATDPDALQALLSTQIRASLTGMERWWADCLEAGELVFAKVPEGSEPVGWDDWDAAEADAVKAQAKAGVSYTARPFQPLKSVVMASAAAYARDYAGRPPSPAQVGKFLTEQDALGVRTKEGGERVQRFRFPALESCRATFAQARPGLRLEDIGGVTTPDNVVQMTTAQAA